jgi:hypothetical protein
LENFGFRVTATGNTDSYHEFWFERAEAYRQPVPCYPHLLTWTDEMQETIRQYDGQYVEALRIYGEIIALKDEKKRLEALNRWDSI